MWRLLYSKKKLTTADHRDLTLKVDDMALSCGAILQDLDSPYRLNQVYVRTIACFEPIENSTNEQDTSLFSYIVLSKWTVLPCQPAFIHSAFTVVLGLKFQKVRVLILYPIENKGHILRLLLHSPIVLQPDLGFVHMHTLYMFQMHCCIQMASS